MKKYFFKATALLLLVGSLVGCSEDKVYYDASNGPALANFTAPSALLGLTSTVSERSVGVQISTISSVDREFVVSADLENSSPDIMNHVEIISTLKIPANEYTGTVTVKSDYYDANDPDNLTKPELTLVLKLDKVVVGKDSSGKEKLAYLEPKGKLFQLTIFNTCDLDAASIGTDYLAVSVAHKFDGDVEIPEFDPGVTKPSSSSPKVLHFKSLWGDEFVSSVTGNATYSGQYLAPATVIINDDLSLTIIPEDSYVSGTGRFDPCTNTFTYTLAQTLFTEQYPISVTVTPIIP